MAYSDLKPDNIVFHRFFNKEIYEFPEYSPSYTIKLIDLGSITFLKDNENF
jgi:hypothetical protein